MNVRDLSLVIVLTTCVGVECATAANQVLFIEGDGESFFEAPDADHLDFELEELTVEAWVHPLDFVGENIVVNKEDSYEFAVVNGTFDTAVQPQGQGWVWHFSGVDVPLDEWSHLAITWDGEFIQMFMNGEWVAESLLEGEGINDSPDTLKVGRRTRGDETHSSFEGFVDEVRISNVIRYQENEDFEVSKTAFTPDENTMALYHFDTADGAGVVKDESMFGNHGQLLGDARLVPDDFLASGTPGDFDGNGVLDAADINDLTAQSASGTNPSSHDLNADSLVDRNDVGIWINDLYGSWMGDANLDREFNSGDLVSLFTAGEYEDGVPGNSTWTTGDFDGDGEFGSGDLVVAFTGGGYEQGPRDAAAAVPEPSGLLLLALSLLTLRRRVTQSFLKRSVLDE